MEIPTKNSRGEELRKNNKKIKNNGTNSSVEGNNKTDKPQKKDKLKISLTAIPLGRKKERKP